MIIGIERKNNRKLNMNNVMVGGQGYKFKWRSGGNEFKGMSHADLESLI